MIKRAILSTFITNVAILALSMGSSILLARWLGPAGRGQIAAALLWPTILIYLGSLGVLPAGLYFAAEPGAPLDAVIGTSSLLCLLLAAASMVVGFLSMPWLLSSQSPEVIWASRAYLLVLPISLLSLCGLNVLQGAMRIQTLNVLRLIGPAGYLVGTIVLSLLGHLGLFNVILLQIGLNVLVLMAGLLALLTTRLLRKPCFDLALAGKMWRYGIKVHVGSAGALVQQRMGDTLLASLAPAAQLGLYVTAVSAAGVIQSISGAVQTVTLPRVRQEPIVADQVRVLMRMTRKYIGIALVAALTYSTVLPWLLTFVFGHEFEPSVLPAEILLVAFMFSGVREILISGTQAMGRPLIGSGVQWLGAGIVAVLLCVLMPRWGIVGAAVAGAIAAAIQVIFIAVTMRVRLFPEGGEIVPVPSHGSTVASILRAGEEFGAVAGPEESMP